MARRCERVCEEGCDERDAGAAAGAAIVDNEVYDLLKATSSKLEGLAAYNKYDRDGQANRDVWRKLRQRDEEAVRELLAQLTQHAKAGKLTAKSA